MRHDASEPKTICEPPSFPLNIDVITTPQNARDFGGVPTHVTLHSTSRQRGRPEWKLPLLVLQLTTTEAELLARTMPNPEIALALFKRSVAAPQLVNDQFLEHAQQSSFSQIDGGNDLPNLADLPALLHWLTNQCTKDNLFRRFPHLQRSNCEELAFLTVFTMDLHHTLDVFRHTSTLASRLSNQDADAIFRLGRYLAITNIRFISAVAALPHGETPGPKMYSPSLQPLQ